MFDVMYSVWVCGSESYGVSIIAAGVGLQRFWFCIFGQILSVLHIWIIWPVVLQSIGGFQLCFTIIQPPIPLNPLNAVRTSSLEGPETEMRDTRLSSVPGNLWWRCVHRKGQQGYVGYVLVFFLDTTQRWLIGMEPVCFSIDYTHIRRPIPRFKLLIGGLRVCMKWNLVGDLEHVYFSIYWL